jgi:hypothetical protein
MTMQSQSRHDHPEIVVFTGDLVGSSKLSPSDLSEAMRTLDAAAHDMARRLSARDRGASAWEPRFSAFRGDGWQCVGPGPALALRGALLMRAHLGALGRPFDTRISIGIGSGWTTDAPNLSVASGPAFELSGRALDAMKGPQRFAIAWQDPPEGAPLITPIFALCDEISRNWTPKQAEVFRHLLGDRERPNQEALARALGRTQQTIAEHLSGGGDWALQEALRAVEGV